QLFLKGRKVVLEHRRIELREVEPSNVVPRYKARRFVALKESLQHAPSGPGTSVKVHHLEVLGLAVDNPRGTDSGRLLVNPVAAVPPERARFDIEVEDWNIRNLR